MEYFELYVKRIRKLCMERGITINKLATMSDVKQSTLLIVSGLIALGVFLQLLQVNLGLEAGLGFQAGREQGGFVHIPFVDAFEVFRAPLVVEDARRDLMAQALFEHEQPADTSVAIPERMCDIHFHIFLDNLVEVALRHLVDVL